MGRPPKDLNDDIIYAMAERGWSDESIAAAFRCDPQTIRNRFSAELAQCRLAGKNKVLDLMYELAFKDREVAAAKYLCDRILGPIETHTKITVEQAQRTLEHDLNSRGIEIDTVIKSLPNTKTEPEPI